MWLVLRVPALAAALVIGCVYDPVGLMLKEFEGPAVDMIPHWAPSAVMWVLVVLSAFVAPVAVLAVVGVQAINPFRSRPFRRPSWRTAFVDIRDPAHFVHLFGWMGVAAGVGRMGADLATGGGPGPSGVGWLLGGLGFLLGVRLSIRAFRTCYQENAAESARPSAGV